MLTFLCDSLYNSKASCASDSQVYGILAQLGEHLPYKQRVIGSSPIGPIDYGWIPEWPKGADCKSVGTAFEGSNPSLPSIANKQGKKYNRITARGGAVWKLAGLITRRS